MANHLQLQFLGSGDAFGSGGRFQTCLYVRDSHDGLLIDCGASSMIPMKRTGINPSEIRWICITHLHGDHFGGVPFLILDGQFNRRTLPIAIAGPPGVETRVRAAMENFFPGSSQSGKRFSVEFVELRPRQPTKIGPSMVTAFAVEHPSGAPAYALRFDWGEKVIVYSGDTGWSENLVDACRGADLFICEAYFFDKQIAHHLDYQTVLKQYNRFECRRLILTHASEDLLGRLKEVEIEVAVDGQIVEL